MERDTKPLVEVAGVPREISMWYLESSTSICRSGDRVLSSKSVKIPASKILEPGCTWLATWCEAPVISKGRAKVVDGRLISTLRARLEAFMVLGDSGGFGDLIRRGRCYGVLPRRPPLQNDGKFTPFISVPVIV